MNSLCRGRSLMNITNRSSLSGSCRLLLISLILIAPKIYSQAFDWESKLAAEGWEKHSAMPLGQTLRMVERYNLLGQPRGGGQWALYLEPNGETAYFTEHVDCPECIVHQGNVFENGEGKFCIFYPIKAGEKEFCYLLWSKEGYLMTLRDNRLFANEWRITPSKHPVFGK